MNVEKFVQILGSDFYAGVPDSLLKPLSDYLYDNFGAESDRHIISANEGNAVGLAAGYHLATGKTPVVYMQNSGEGNVVNPVASLLNNEVYAIPCIFVIGWRGEPGVHDEPQHIYQGKITRELMELLDVDSFVLTKDTTAEELESALKGFGEKLALGKSVAIVVKKGALSYEKKKKFSTTYTLNRESVIEKIVECASDGAIVSTTGKISRELFEIRAKRKEDHSHDFLTVGSMGHSSSVALGIALNKPETKVWCIDGDGAVLMHAGAMAVMGNRKPSNVVHVLINNCAHETVGGMPTVSDTTDFVKLALSFGYPYAKSVSDEESLVKELETAGELGKLAFIEIKCALGSRADLGRPTTTAVENKKAFMSFLSSVK